MKERAQDDDHEHETFCASIASADEIALVHFSLYDGDELETRSQGEQEGATARQVDDILLEMNDVKSELLHVRELTGVLARKERCAETKAEIVARRLDRLEREQDEQDDKEHEANLQEALSDKTKVVKPSTSGLSTKAAALTKCPQAKLSSSMLAWCGACRERRGPYRGGRNTWKEERDREKANRVAQQVRRAAALTPELVAQVAHTPRPK